MPTPDITNASAPSHSTDSNGVSASDINAPAQCSQTSNISLGIDDLITSDRNINLDLLNALTLTPPKPAVPLSSTRHPSPVQRREVSPVRPSESASPMVVPVTMYWNTFPALFIDDVKYVRLIDISRQALPSKETGLSI